MRDLEERLERLLPFMPSLCPPRPTVTKELRVKGELVRETVERVLPEYGVHAEKIILFVNEEKRSGMPKFSSATQSLPSYIQGDQVYHPPDMKWKVAKGGTNKGVLVRNPKRSQEKVGFIPMKKYVGYICKVSWMGKRVNGVLQNVLRVDLKEYSGFLPKGAFVAPSLEEVLAMEMIQNTFIQRT